MTAIFSLFPTDALQPLKVVSREFSFGSMAGSMGKKIDEDKKPGINEDGASVVARKDNLIGIVIDGHYGRETTELLLTEFNKKGGEGLEDGAPLSDAEFLDWCLAYCHHMVEVMQLHNSAGEASIILFYLNQATQTFHYFSIGDLLLFAFDPKRFWRPVYQLTQRQYFEWINQIKIKGYHFGSISVTQEMKIIVASDGLIDEPIISFEDIRNIFDKLEEYGSDAKGLVQYALKENPDDDNILVILLDKITQ